MIKEFDQLNELLYNNCIGTDFKKKKKFAGIINPEEDTLNMWNQHQLHQSENTVKNTSLHLHAHSTIQIALHMFVCISLSYACLILRYFRVIIA